MKRIFIGLLLLTLTGCGASKCDLKFMSNMTNNYSKDAKKCEKVTYVNKEKNMTVITTPSADKSNFVAQIMVNDIELEHSFMMNEFTNIKINTYKNINFLELYNTNGYIDLVVLDAYGNVRYEMYNTSLPIINDGNFTLKEYLLRLDSYTSDYICSNYNEDKVAYREKTYSINDTELIEIKEVRIKDICK